MKENNSKKFWIIGIIIVVIVIVIVILIVGNKNKDIDNNVENTQSTNTIVNSPDNTGSDEEEPSGIQDTDITSSGEGLQQIQSN